MLVELKTKNNSIRELQDRIRQSTGRTSRSEVEEMLIAVADRKAFVLLLDMYETEKEITRELLEDFMEHSYEMNNGIFMYMEKRNDLSEVLERIFNVKNIKAIIIASVALGIVFAVATNEVVAKAVVEKLTETEEKKEK